MHLDPRAALDFYVRLRAFDLDDPQCKLALAFSRSAQDLLFRVASAWSVQHGLQEIPLELLPQQQRLFDAKFHDRTLSGERNDSQLELLLAGCANWLAAGYGRDGFADCYQVVVQAPGNRELQLFGSRRDTPCPPGLTLAGSDTRDWVSTRAHGRVRAIGHYDVHGISMLALSLRSLRAIGFAEASGILSFEDSGDIGKLWKRTVPHSLQEVGEGGTVMLIDCPVNSRTPEHTVRGLRGLDSIAGSEVFLIDHHADTIMLAPRLSRPGLQMLLTDVLGCAVLGEDDTVSRELRLLGALADKVPEIAIALKGEQAARLSQANDAFHRELLHFSPTPKPFRQTGQQPAQALWEALASGQLVEAGLALQGDQISSPGPPARDYAHLLCGGLVFVSEKLEIPGRMWYSLLERLMEENGRSYAVALRVLDGHRANMMLLTHWQHSHVPPIKLFVPSAYWPACLGHPAAVWVDLPLSSALPFLDQVQRAANEFLMQQAEFDHVAVALQQNILR